MEKKYSGIELLDIAKDIEQSLPRIREEVFIKIRNKYPSCQYKDFKSLNIGFRHNKLPQDMHDDLYGEIEEIEKLKNKAKIYREQSEVIFRENAQKNQKKLLNPSVDIVPADQYPKLAKCTIYPLRKSCNYGENIDTRWTRCEFMKYDNSKSIFDSARWYCSYKNDS